MRETASPYLGTPLNLAISTPGWLRAVFIIVILLGSVVLGYLGTSTVFQLVILGIVSLSSILVYFRWPTVALFGIIATGMLIQYVGPGGVNETIFLIIVLFGLWILDMVVFKNEVHIVISRTFPPLIGLLFLSILGLGMGFLPWFTYVKPAPIDAQVGGFAAYALSYIAYLLVANHVRTIRTLTWMTWGFVGLGSVYVGMLLMVRTLNQAGALPASVLQIYGTLFGSLGSIFYIWLISITYSQAIFNDGLSIKWRVVLAAIALAGVYILFGLKFKDKSGWVPILIVVWFITFLRSWRVGLGLLLLGALGAISLIPQVLESEEYSLSTRVEILPIFWQLIRANPIFGIGFANYHFYTELFSLRGWYTSFNSHNNYVDIAVQTGLLGLVVFLWFMAKAAILGWELRARVTGGFAKAYVNGALGGLLGMFLVSALGDWVLPFVYNIGLSGFSISVMGWYFLGGVVVLEQIFYPLEK